MFPAFWIRATYDSDGLLGSDGNGNRGSALASTASRVSRDILRVDGNSRFAGRSVAGRRASAGGSALSDGQSLSNGRSDVRSDNSGVLAGHRGLLGRHGALDGQGGFASDVDSLGDLVGDGDGGLVGVGAGADGLGHDRSAVLDNHAWDRSGNGIATSRVSAGRRGQTRLNDAAGLALGADGGANGDDRGDERGGLGRAVDDAAGAGSDGEDLGGGDGEGHEVLDASTSGVDTGRDTSREAALGAGEHEGGESRGGVVAADGRQRSLSRDSRDGRGRSRADWVRHARSSTGGSGACRSGSSCGKGDARDLVGGGASWQLWGDLSGANGRLYCNWGRGDDHGGKGGGGVGRRRVHGLSLRTVAIAILTTHVAVTAGVGGISHGEGAEESDSKLHHHVVGWMFLALFLVDRLSGWAVSWEGRTMGLRFGGY